MLRAFFIAVICIPCLVSSARADDWLLTSVSGQVLVFSGGQWNRLRQGHIVADDSVIRSLPDGSALFTRDHERIGLAPNTQIQIFDRAGQRYTIVRQDFGTVGIEANVENVRHFSVRTPFLAAVVKGTIFGVETDAVGSAVSVVRGAVGVDGAAQGRHVLVRAGESATANPAAPSAVGPTPTVNVALHATTVTTASTLSAVQAAIGAAASDVTKLVSAAAPAAAAAKAKVSVKATEASSATADVKTEDAGSSTKSTGRGLLTPTTPGPAKTKSTTGASTSTSSKKSTTGSSSAPAETLSNPSIK